jgi:hypothetical protein
MTTFTKDDFYNKIGQVESANNPNIEAGDKGNSIGQYQIGKPYFIDAWGNADKYNDLKLADKGPELGRQTIDRFMARYGKDHLSNTMSQSNMEYCARLHNRGPQANDPNRLKSTDDYIERFKAFK